MMPRRTHSRTSAARSATANAVRTRDTVLRIVCVERPRASAISAVDFPSHTISSTARSVRESCMAIGSCKRRIVPPRALAQRRPVGDLAQRAVDVVEQIRLTADLADAQRGEQRAPLVADALEDLERLAVMVMRLLPVAGGVRDDAVDERARRFQPRIVCERRRA